MNVVCVKYTVEQGIWSNYFFQLILIRTHYPSLLLEYRFQIPYVQISNSTLV